MKKAVLSLTVGLLLPVVFTAAGAALYVDVNNPAPMFPYTNWVTAASNIQDAVDAAVEGDQIWVTNGVYETGARDVYGMSNRVAVTKAVVVQSVNGPGVTFIRGYGPIGPAAVRCVYLTNGAVLAGFTLMNGGTQPTGDGTRQQSGAGVWCESGNALVSNCVVAGNWASYAGGGAYSGTLNNCTLTGNRASRLSGQGGSSVGRGGGVYAGTLYNCTLSGNSALEYGGGAYNCTLNNSTLTGNSASSGGGAHSGTLNNCIIYYNTAEYGSNSFGSSLSYCCTKPIPGGGTGNLSAEPQLASASHLSASSPCRGAGSLAYARGVDIDGEAWANPPSIGCDEYCIGSITGEVSAAILVSYTNVPVRFALDLQAVIAGRVSASSWDFGDGVVVSNRPYASHAWAAAGDYSVLLRAYNESYPDGVAASVTVHVVREHYVALSNPCPAWPYGSWATAATNIQDAVDVAIEGDEVWVTNGLYQIGGRVVHGMSNRVALTKAVTVQSLNGPEVTIIRGSGPVGSVAVRCVYLTNGAVLAGFTLTNGATQSFGDVRWQESGGGVWCESASAVISNCVVTGNRAFVYGGGAFQGTLNNCMLTANSASSGGGAFNCTLNDSKLINNSAGSCGGAFGGTLSNCTLSGNSASGEGGGVGQSVLNNCTLAANSAPYGGGAYSATLNNCLLTGNRALWSGGGAYSGTLNNCVLRGNWVTNGPGGGAYQGTLNNSTLAANSALYGGGASYGTLNNCTLTVNSATNSGGGAYLATLNNSIVYYNTAPDGNYSGGALNYCCTMPLPGTGTANFDNAPLFGDLAGGNLRLEADSPCINAGLNAYASGATDLDGNPRITGGTVDVGAYEFQSPASVISYAWLQLYGLPTDGSADHVDTDNDQMNNWQEWVAGTDPTNAGSVLRLLPPLVGPDGVTLTWLSMNSRSYYLERATNLPGTPGFSVLLTDIAGLAGTTTCTDTNPPASGPAYYRVGVRR